MRLLRLLAGAGLIVPLLVLAAVGTASWDTKQQEAWDSTARIADIAYESVSKLVDAQLLVLDEAQQLVEPMDDQSVLENEAALHGRLQVVLRHLPHVRDVFIVGRQGHALAAASFFPAPHTVDLTDRDYFCWFAEGHSGLFVSQPGLRRSDGRRYFALAVPRSSAKGEFDGVVAASVSPEFFQRYFQQAGIADPSGGDRAVTIRRGDGLLLVRSPPQPGGWIGSDNLAFDDPAASGRFIQKSDSDGLKRLVVWRRLPNANMIVSASITMRAVWRDWRQTMIGQLYFGVPATLALFVITLLAMRRTRQAEQAAMLAERETQKRHQAEEAVRQHQKLEALGKLTGGVAHDFNNLLAVILGNAELAKRRAPEIASRQLDAILHASQRAASLTRQLLSFARNQTVAPRVLDLRQELPRMEEILKPSLRGDIALAMRIEEHLWPVEIDPGEWEMAILNVAVNARDAMPSGGKFTIEARNIIVRPGDVEDSPSLSGAFVKVTLIDTGAGMTPETARHAFEPFFTTKEIGRGTGLGLSQVYGFAHQAGGAIGLSTGPGRGTAVSIYLPRSRKMPAQEAAKAPVPSSAEPRRVLLVEDNVEVSAINADLLRGLGYSVEAVTNARAALERLEGHPPDLLLTDVVLPDGISGLELAREVRRCYPNLPVLLATGYSDVLLARPGEFRVLRKPFSLRQLDDALDREFRRRPHTASARAERVA